MPVIKSINSRSNSKAALKATLNYVFQGLKTTQELCFVTGDYMELEITPEKILRNFMETKELFEKEGGRMYKHFVISWHKDCPVTHEEALEMCKEWAEKVFPDFNCAISIHRDRDYVHGHIVVNSVSFIDGRKYHMNPQDLEAAKKISDEINIARGFSIVEKGKHYDGSDIEEGTIRSYDKDTYKALHNTERSNHLTQMITAILDVKSYATSKEEFISELYDKYGIEVTWEDKRKYITFLDIESGFKARNKNLGNTFTIDLSKEELLNEFERNKGLQEQQLAEKAELDSRAGELDEGVRGVIKEYRNPEADHRTDAEKNSTVGGRSGNVEFREWPVERLSTRVTDSGKRSAELISWGKNIIKTLGNALSRIRIFSSGGSVDKEALDWEATQLADTLERYRSEIASIERNLQLHILPHIGLKPFFKEEAKREYQDILYRLDSYKFEMQNANPMVLILAQAKRNELRPQVEADSLRSAINMEFDFSKEELEKAVKASYKVADSMLSDVHAAMENLTKEHNLEPIQYYNRGPRTRGR